MMGVQETPARLFYVFCLNEHVPCEHLLRGVDRHLDLANLRRSLKPFYSQMGRPSIDPELCRLGLDGKVPDHSTFSKNRHGRFRQSDALRQLFESVVQRCVAEGLVGAEGFAVDASLIAADANKQRSVPSNDWRPEELKENAVRAAREYLATLDDAAFGAASPVTPKFISRSDPAAQWTGAHKGHALLRLCRQLFDRHRPRRDCRRGSDAGYPASRGWGSADDARADGNPLWREAGLSNCGQRLWFSGEPGLARQTEGDHATHSCLRQVQSDGRHVLPRRLPLRSRTRPLHVPCRQGTGPVSAHLRNPRSGVTAEGTRLYRASKLDCDVCQLKAQCCPNAVARKIPRDLHEDARDVARALAATPEYEAACRLRKKVEMLFAHLKRILRLARLRLRGPNGARDEFLLAATAQNLRRLARLRPTGGLEAAIGA